MLQMTNIFIKALIETSMQRVRLIMQLHIRCLIGQVDMWACMIVELMSVMKINRMELWNMAINVGS